MRQLLLILLLCSGSFTACRAQQYFNRRETLHAGTALLTSVTGRNGLYYCTGICIDSVNVIPGSPTVKLIRGIKLAIFDSNGYKVRDTVYQNGQKSIWSWYAKPQWRPDGSFIQPADQTDSAGNFSLALFCFDSLGHLLWQREYARPSGNCPFPTAEKFWRMVDFQPDGRGGWLMLSTLQCEAQSEMLLTKLDSAFNVIWHKTYGVAGMSEVAGRLVVEQDGYLFAGCKVNNGINLWISQALIVKTDTAGHQVWGWESPVSEFHAVIRDILRLPDGGYLYCGAGDGFRESYPQGSEIYYRGWVQRLDAAGNPLWGRGFNRTYSETGFNKMLANPDGTITLVGSKLDFVQKDSLAFDAHANGWWLKINLNGDSLSERLYSAVTSCDDKNVFYDAIRTAHSGWLMVGESTDQCYNFTPTRQRGWLVKVDRDGCSGANDPRCWPLAVAGQAPATTALRLYPNPAGRQLRAEAAGSGLLQLSDGSGRPLLRFELAAGGNNLDVGSLPPGIYFYRFSSAGAATAVGKLIRQ